MGRVVATALGARRSCPHSGQTCDGRFVRSYEHREQRGWDVGELVLGSALRFAIGVERLP